MKQIFIFIFILFATLKGFSQNLVSNPGFDDTLACPYGFGDISNAAGWDSYARSPDYMHTCSSHWLSSAPLNGTGYQVPASGSAYAGFTAYSTRLFHVNVRELIGRPLDSALTIGTTYYASLKVSLGYKPVLDANCACNNVGLTFSTLSYVGDTMPVNDNPQVFSSAVISDTLDWTLITGSFIADSAYTYVVIGNFFSDTNTDTLILNGDSLCRHAYYFVDDICVTSDSAYFFTMTAVLNEQQHAHAPVAFPNPFGDFTTIRLDRFVKDSRVDLTDPAGRLIRTFPFSGMEIILKRENLSPGIYFLRVFSEQGLSFIKLVAG